MGDFTDRLLTELASVPGDFYSRVVEGGFDEGIRRGILNTARALFRQGLADTEAVAELSVIWNLAPSDARKALYDAKLHEAMIALSCWLQANRGLDEQAALHFAEDALSSKIKEQPDLTVLWKKPERLAEAAGLA